MARLYHEPPEPQIKIVADGESLELGGKTLRFIGAPWFHWPETTFTYLSEDKILFPCDFFGAHTAQGIYDEDIEELIPFAKRYYGEITMPFGKKRAKSFEKNEESNFKIIAPSHGPFTQIRRGLWTLVRNGLQGRLKIKPLLSM